jgi:uncharacterized membrane protein
VVNETKASAAIRFAPARTRVGVAVIAGLAVFGVAALFAAWQVAVLAGWSTAGLVFVVWAVGALWALDGKRTAEVATREDSSRALADLLLLSAATGSLVAIGVGLLKAGSSKGAAQALITALAVLTVATSWAVVHTVYALRYARIYYTEGGGVDFPEDDNPDYRDFAYLALTLGMTFQVSDTDLTSKSIRRTATRHALLSYLFGAVILGVVINVVASLLNH